MCFVVSVFSLYLMKVLFVDMKWIFEYVFLFRLMMLILFGTHHQRHPVAYYDDLQKLLVRCWNMITKILTEADSILSFLTLHGRKHLVEDTGNPVQCIEAIYLHTHNFALCFWCFANESTDVHKGKISVVFENPSLILFSKLSRCHCIGFRTSVLLSCRGAESNWRKFCSSLYLYNCCKVSIPVAIVWCNTVTTFFSCH